MTLLQAALARDPAASRTLVERLMPVVQVRVARSLARYGNDGRNRREEAAELTQDTFGLLLEKDGRILQSWDPGKGLSLENFVGLVAERHARSVVKSRKRSPWTEQPEFDIDSMVPPTRGPEAAVTSKQLLSVVFGAIEAELSPKGLGLFEALIVQQRAAPEVAKELGLSTDAVYQWKRRLLVRVRQALHAHGATPPEPPRRVSRDR